MTKQIQLTQGYCAIVDDEDFDYLNQFKWHKAAEGPSRKRRGIYAQRKIKAVGAKYRQRTILMHRIILGEDDPAIQIDHRDGNGLNNTRSNLRRATRTQNAQNRQVCLGRSGYKGVFDRKTDTKWRAMICINHHLTHLGTFDDKESAARAYDAAAVEFFGEFANTNFPPAPKDQSHAA